MDREFVRSEIIQLLQNLARKGMNSYITINEIIHNFENKPGYNGAVQNMVFEEIHLLLLNNVLMRAVGWGMVPAWNDLKLTEFGSKCLLEGYIIPLDPDGYLKQIKESVPQIDILIFEYLSESIATFNRSLVLSSTITLGVASEQAVLLLIESFCKFIENSTLRGYIDKFIKERFVSTKYDILEECLDKLPKEVKSKLPDNYDTTIDTLFHFIKINRDKTGHPKGGGKDRGIQQSNLQAFKSYLSVIYKLISYFDSNKLQ
jgi:hypothetical protein